MKTNILFITIVLIGLQVNSVQAQEGSTEASQKVKKINWNSDLEASLLQFANYTANGYSKRTIPRFTYFFNVGVEASLNSLKKNPINPFTGISIKNIGLITKSDSVKNKYRVYALGVPVGFRIKIGANSFLKTGVDFNWAFNYKEKTFINDKKKSKFNEFFSDRTAQFYPAFFGGLEIEKMKICTAYYPVNLFNQSYTSKNGLKPYTNVEANIFTVSVGVDLQIIFQQRNKKNSNTEASSTEPTL